MKTLVDLRVLDGEWSGIAVYVCNLCHGLQENDNTLNNYSFLFQSLKGKEAFEKYLGWGLPPESFVYLDKGVYNPFSFLEINKITKKLSVDIFFTPQFFWPFFLIKNTKVVNVIHDLIPLQYPKLLWHSKKTKFKFLFKFSTLLSLRASRMTFVDSKATLETIRGFFGEKEIKKCRILYPGVWQSNNEALLKKNNLNQIKNISLSPYILYVGRQDPYKNLLRLIKSFKIFNRKNPTFKLILCGKVDSRYPELQEEVITQNLKEKVLFTGFVNADSLVNLYSSCEFVVQPSLVEGFGLTSLEPLRFQKLCAVSNRTALPEVLGDLAVFFDPFSINDMARGLEIAKQRSKKISDDVKEQMQICLQKYNPIKTAELFEKNINNLL